ncbi:bacitracin resistance protein [Microbacterium sp. 4R-513]|uniref:bacitracin resistance protein n=1 Tax=Microbacterium sp. 4R-513 TaxID=2567934 RepID=UPI001F4A01CF|nr:bacitracin resistance protein [Microbacterium sp. 4R-513]
MSTVESTRRPILPVWLIATIAGVFLLLYAYVVWSAVAFLVQQASGVEGLSGYGWFVLLLPIVFPLVVFAAAFAIGWRRNAGQFALVLLTGLGLVAAFWLNIFAYAAASTALYGG